MSAAVWAAMWPVQRLRQREFFEFGMEVSGQGGWVSGRQAEGREAGGQQVCWSYSMPTLPPPYPQVLLKLDLAETREFFAAFFSLSYPNWTGFLSSRLSFLQLITFGLELFYKSSGEARLNMLKKGLPGLAVMLSRLPTLK